MRKLPECEVDWCDRNVKSSVTKLCPKHYKQMYRHGRVARTRNDMNRVVIREAYCSMYLEDINGKEIAEVKFDLVDSEILTKCRWTYFSNGYAKSYKHNILMHRMLMDIPADYMCDHINQDKLDNRRSNLRTVTKSQNMQNVNLRRSNTSGYTGVYYQACKWVAEIKCDDIKYYLGRFNDKHAAALAYNNKALELYGEHACLNDVPNITRTIKTDNSIKL